MKKLLVLGIVVLILFAAYWLLAPVFITQTVDDALPEGFAPLDEPTEFESEAELQRMIGTMPDVSMDDDDPMPRKVRLVTVDTPRSDQNEQSVPSDESFPIEDTIGHPATGDIRVINTGSETIVRYENYDGTNGPDLFVYLAKDLDATEFVNLGRSKGNQGNANYSVPDDVDISDYQYVMTWCKAFGVLFDYAEIN